VYVDVFFVCALEIYTACFRKFMIYCFISESECSDIGLMLELCYVFLANSKEPAVARQMLRVFFEELVCYLVMDIEH